MKSQFLVGLLGLGGLAASRRNPVDDPLVRHLYGESLADMSFERRDAPQESYFKTRDEAAAEPRFLNDMTKSETFPVNNS